MVAIQKGESWLGESPLPFSRWVENAGDAALFVDAAAASAYATARSVVITFTTPAATGNKNNGKKTN